jgi:hypothetical protein
MMQHIPLADTCSRTLLSATRWQSVQAADGTCAFVLQPSIVQIDSAEVIRVVDFGTCS